MFGNDALVSEVSDFAVSMARLVAVHPTPDRWRPDVPCDDRTPALREGLAAIGWFELAPDPENACFLGPAALELGRALAPVSAVDEILHASVAVPTVGSDRSAPRALVRYLSDGAAVLLCTPEGIVAGTASSAQPVCYTDAWGAHEATVDLTANGFHSGAPEVSDAWQAWLVAMTGYLAGLVAGAHECTLAHVRSRIAFGKPLIAIESVSNKMADVLMIGDGLRLAAGHPASVDVLRYAGGAATQAVASCHQLVGAIGFTLEFPLQRYSRRITALASWNEQVLDALGAESATSLALSVSR